MIQIFIILLIGFLIGVFTCYILDKEDKTIDLKEGDTDKTPIPTKSATIVDMRDPLDINLGENEK